ncbi:MAG: hypothetical protein Q8M11_02710 [Sulfuritalea sp.]|nr:hypothetical protein [Sulfuritalea sp.]MDP1984273.1 hypothetical protein [Sulfuritalea sp.]
MRRLGACLLAVCGCVAGGVALAETGKIEAVPAVSSDADTAGDSQVQELPADTSGQLQKQFKRENPEFREHVFKLNTDVYEDNDSNPGVRLERVWVGATGTLVELTGLPRKGKPYSAMMNKETLRLAQSRGGAGLLRAEGVTEMQDRRGGSALVLKPGETLYLWFGPIDDIDAFSIVHRLPGGKRFAYFENLDPRFLDRYHRDYAAATTPEKRYQFLLDYVSKDPENKVGGVFSKLMQDFRDLNTFEGYYRAYLIAQLPSDAKMAQKLAATDEHRTKMEHLAVVTLADKNRLFDFDLRLINNGTRKAEGSCWMFCKYNFAANKPLSGSLTVKQRGDSPIKIRYGRYKVTLAARVNLPRHLQRKSGWTGDYDGADDQTYNVETSVEVAPGHLATPKNIDLGTLEIAAFERGSAGGFHAIWATNNPTVSMRIKQVDLIP